MSAFVAIWGESHQKISFPVAMLNGILGVEYGMSTRNYRNKVPARVEVDL